MPSGMNLPPDDAPSEQPPDTPDPAVDAPELAFADAPTLTRRPGGVLGRVLRRPFDWLDRPWTNERLVQYFTALIVLLGSAVVLLKVVHIDLVFEDNTPTGGDMGAHVLGPAYLRDHLLPHFQLTGWSNYWYNGFPIYRFYMLPPALLIVAFNLLLPYGVAFKLVACNALGCSLPSGASNSVTPWGAPGVPGVSATRVADQTIRLCWSFPASNGRPVTVAYSGGTAFNFVHLLDAFPGRRWNLPSGSYVLETGEVVLEG